MSTSAQARAPDCACCPQLCSCLQVSREGQGECPRAPGRRAAQQHGQKRGGTRCRRCTGRPRPAAGGPPPSPVWGAPACAPPRPAQSCPALLQPPPRKEACSARSKAPLKAMRREYLRSWGPARVRDSCDPRPAPAFEQRTPRPGAIRSFDIHASQPHEADGQSRHCEEQQRGKAQPRKQAEQDAVTSWRYRRCPGTGGRRQRGSAQRSL